MLATVERIPLNPLPVPVLRKDEFVNTLAAALFDEGRYFSFLPEGSRGPSHVSKGLNTYVGEGRPADMMWGFFAVSGQQG